MRAIRGLTVLGLALVMMGHTPGAWACSCPTVTVASSFRAADVVFIGTVASREDPNTGNVHSSNDPITWTFTVQSVQKGTTSSPQTVESARDSVSCGFEFTVGKRYQVFADRSSSGLKTDICTSTAGLVAGAAGFRVRAAHLAHTGPPNKLPWVLLPFAGAALALGGAAIVRAARNRAVFTWPR
jgi:hypothetical protein